MSRLRSLLLASTAIMLLGTGCASGTGKPSTPTGGISIWMQQRDNEQLKFVLYQVDADGMLAWGGGQAASMEETTWEMLLEPEQVSQLRTVLREAGWLDGKPSGEGSGGDRRTKVRFRWPEGSWKWSIRGTDPALEPVEQLLYQYSLVRLESALQRLPEAGKQN
ncbi:MAG: hypothetical protein CMJ32_08820 [Phycisphaerae bacterium]|nr:hypothetical protein [Phycisphaerae bacterium]